jgi:hypothetical protein
VAVQHGASQPLPKELRLALGRRRGVGDDCRGSRTAALIRRWSHATTDWPTGSTASPFAHPAPWLVATLGLALDAE